MKRDLQVKECEDGGYEIARVIAESESIVEWECLAQVHDEDDARLFAAAPKMLEMLRRLEWACRDEMDTSYCKIFNADSPGHAPDCELAAILKEGA